MLRLLWRSGLILLSFYLAYGVRDTGTSEHWDMACHGKEAVPSLSRLAGWSFAFLLSCYFAYGVRDTETLNIGIWHDTAAMDAPPTTSCPVEAMTDGAWYLPFYLPTL